MQELKTAGRRKETLTGGVWSSFIQQIIITQRVRSSLENVDVETFELVCVFFQGRQKSKHQPGEGRGWRLANLAFSA